MTKSVRMQPMARAAGKPRKISITNSDWNMMEANYGKQLSTDVRQRIVDATNKFLYWEEFERNAIPASEATKLIASIRVESNKLRAASSKLRKLLSASGGQTGFVAQRLIKEHFDTPHHLTLESHHQLFHVLGKVLFPLSPVSFDGALSSLSSACTQALAAEEDESDNRPFREGSAWDDWIWQLTKLAKENGLPWQVSKDSIKSSRVSPFARLVTTLQKQLLGEAARHRQGPDGLASAIVRVRDKVKKAENNSASAMLTQATGQKFRRPSKKRPD